PAYSEIPSQALGRQEISGTFAPASRDYSKDWRRAPARPPSLWTRERPAEAGLGFRLDEGVEDADAELPRIAIVCLGIQCRHERLVHIERDFDHVAGAELLCTERRFVQEWRLRRHGNRVHLLAVDLHLNRLRARERAGVVAVQVKGARLSRVAKRQRRHLLGPLPFHAGIVRRGLAGMPPFLEKHEDIL